MIGQPTQQRAPAGQPQGPQPGPAAQQAAQQVPQTNATPEEQAAYDQVVLAGLRTLYMKGDKAGEGTHEQVMEMIRAGANPPQTVARITSIIIKEIDQQMNNAIPESVILPAAMEIMDAVAEMAAAAGAFDLDANAAEIAVDILVTDLAEAYNVSIDEVRALLDQFDDEELAFLGEEATRNAHAWTPV